MKYTIDSIGGMCPTQAEGNLEDGRAFYFRARNGRWTLDISTQPALPDLAEWGDSGALIAQGEDLTGGFMDDNEVGAILDQHLGGVS